MLKSRIAAAIAGSLHVGWRRRRKGPGHDQGRRQSADERPERGAWRDLLARRQHRGEAHQRRQDAVEEARARDRGQPGDPAGRRGGDEQARQRRPRCRTCSAPIRRFPRRSRRSAIAPRSSASTAARVGPDLAELGDYFWNVIPLVNFEAEVLIPYRREGEGAEEHRADLRRRSARRGGAEGAARRGAEGGRQAGRRAAGPARRAAVRLDRRERAPAQAGRDLSSRRSARR